LAQRISRSLYQKCRTPANLKEFTCIGFITLSWSDVLLGFITIAKLGTAGKQFTNSVSIDIKLYITMSTYMFLETSLETDRMLHYHISLNQGVPTCKRPKLVHTCVHSFEEIQSQAPWLFVPTNPGVKVFRIFLHIVGEGLFHGPKRLPVAVHFNGFLHGSNSPFSMFRLHSFNSIIRVAIDLFTFTSAIRIISLAAKVTV
jgi:hypothetical protein